MTKSYIQFWVLFPCPCELVRWKRKKGGKDGLNRGKCRSQGKRKVCLKHTHSFHETEKSNLTMSRGTELHRTAFLCFLSTSLDYFPASLAGECGQGPDAGQRNVRRHDAPYFLANKNLPLPLSVRFPFSLAWCRRACWSWKPRVEDSRATRREGTGSLNHCVKQSCPWYEYPFWISQEWKINLCWMCSVSVCLLVSYKWRDGSRWGKARKGLLCAFSPAWGRGSFCSRAPPASLSQEVNCSPLRAGHLLFLDKIQEGIVSLNSHPSFKRAPEAH